LAEGRTGPVGGGGAAQRTVVARPRGVSAGHDRPPARARDDDAPAPGLHLVDAGELPDGAHRLPGAGGRDGADVRRSQLDERLLRVPWGDRVPASLLVLRAPRRLRGVLPVRRSRRGGDRDLLAQALVRLPAVRPVADALRDALDV